MSIGADPTLGGKLIDLGEHVTLVIEGASIIDGTGAPQIDDGVIVVRGGRVAAIGPRHSTRVPRGRNVRHLDGAGRFVIPGLIDCHVHLTGDHYVDTHRRYMDAVPRARVLRAAEHAAHILAAGFTTVRNLGHGDATYVAAVRRAITEGLVPGPRILSAGWSISQTGGHGNLRIWPYSLVEAMRPRSAFADGAHEVAALVRQNILEGAECIKIYATEGVIYTPDRLSDIPNFSPAELRAITTAAHRRRRKVAAHSTGVDGSIAALRAGVDTIEHGPHEPDTRFLAALRDAKATLVPTLSVFDWAASAGPSGPYPAWVGERAARRLDGRFAVVRAARELGVPIASGSDSGGPPRGGQNARELELLVQAGLSPLEAIVAATRDSARALGIGDQIGTLERGKVADLLLLNSDPIRDIASLRNGSVALVMRARHGA